MSTISRFGSTFARSIMLQQHRHMASATTATDPIQKLFIDKIREFKTSNKGLDAAHTKALNEELARLSRVFKIDNESKLTQLEYKFSDEHDITLHDVDESKELRAKVHSGEFQKQLSAEPKPVSALLATIPEQVTLDMHLPPMNKPNYSYANKNSGVPGPPVVGGYEPDYHYVGGKMTPAKLERELCVKFNDNMPTIHDDEAPERDTVNFPRQPQAIDTPPTRYHVLPESWFRFFYPKTGVTGPYAFFATFSTFLLSKEWVPVEHEFCTMLSTTIIFAGLIIKFGPQVRAMTLKLIDEDHNGWDKWQKGHIEFLEKMQDHYRTQLAKNDVLGVIYEARKQDVEVQLECERRLRLKSIHDDIKRRLNYLVAKADAQRQISQNNMVNWVISNVLSSIDQRRENEVLDNCIGSLRQLSLKNANVI